MEQMVKENQNVKLEVNMKDETVWLSLDQMAELMLLILGLLSTTKKIVGHFLVMENTAFWEVGLE